MPANERLSAGRILSHLAVMIAVAAVMGVVVAGLAIPFAGALGIGARGVASSIEELPADLETRDLAQKTQIVDAEFLPHPHETVGRHRICGVRLVCGLAFEIFEPFGDLLSASG